MQRFIKFISAPWLMGSLFVLLAVAMASATFLENSYGTDAARVLVYNAKWFELIFALLVVNMTASIFQFNMLKKSKISVLIFHISFIIIIVGAAITRYLGDEGLMAIRQGEKESSMLSLDPAVKAVWTVGDKSNAVSKTSFLSVVTPFEFNKKLKANGKSVKIKSVAFIPNARSTPVNADGGEPMALITLSGRASRHELVFRVGEKRQFESHTIGFETENDPTVDIHIRRANKNSLHLELISKLPFSEMQMGASRVEPQLQTEPYLLHKGQLYEFENLRFVLSDYLPSGKMLPITTYDGKDNGTPHAVIFEVESGSKKEQVTVLGRNGIVGNSETIELPDGQLQISFGARQIEMPFNIQLDEFVLTRYPGSESPSSYLSKVTLIDEEKGIEEKREIFMNNILNYRGYRLYQSSYDLDEKGTVLSVNHDGLGTFITYMGYFLMILGMAVALLQPNTRFRNLIKRVNDIQSKRKGVVTMLFLLISSNLIFSQSYIPPIPDKNIAEEFGSLWVQDNGGRTKPLNTMHQEVVVKMVKHNSFLGHNVDQMVLSILMNPAQWQNIPLFTVKEYELRSILKLTDKKASFNHFFDEQRHYIIHNLVDNAHRTNPAHRTKLDQELIKVDEQVNIFYSLITGRFHRIYPDNIDSHQPWVSPTSEITGFEEADSLFIKSSLPQFITACYDKDFKSASNILLQISEFQKAYGGEILPTETHGKMERLYNKLNIFLWLSTLFFGLGGMLILYQFILLLFPSIKDRFVSKAGNWVILLGFAYYTFGLALRWYVAGHAPWSNGYESMIFIGWAILFASLFWIHRSSWMLPIASTFSGLVLMVAHLSWMNPEITNLVPVLQSYWLTLHVSVITAGYGFLALGALLGFLTLITMSLRNNRNKIRLQLTIDELTAINEMSLTVGLYLMTIGSFLGGIWANESWGRYWGWDAKETWSLITIVIYALVLHLRLIPGWKGKLTYNIASLISIASVIMTYLGVNYYLSGLHSYGSGDLMPFPTFAYYTIAVVFILIFFAWNNERKFKTEDLATTK